MILRVTLIDSSGRTVVKHFDHDDERGFNRYTWTIPPLCDYQVEYFPTHELTWEDALKLEASSEQ